MFRLFQEDIRAADADREETVELLKRHYADGRLTASELSARVDAAYAAVGLLELDALLRDLPPLATPSTATRPAGAGRRAGKLMTVALALIGMLLVAAAIPSELWALLLFFGLPLAMMGLFVLLPVALPVLAMAWISRSLGGGSGDPAPRRLGRGAGWVGTWHFDDLESRHHRAVAGRRRRGWFDL